MAAPNGIRILTTYTDLRAAPRLDLSAVVPLSVPMALYIEPSNRCNLSCSFCPQSLDDYEERSGGRMDIDMDLYRKVIAEVSTFDPRPKSIKLYFLGEPLLHPEIQEIMTLAVSVCDRVEVTTNGLVLTEKKAQAILDSGIHYLRVSVYLYEGIRTDIVRRNVERLRDMRNNQRKSRPFISAKVFGQKERDMIEPYYSSITDEITCETMHSFASDFVNISQQPKGKASACPYPFYTLVVKSNGDVVPCCVAWEGSLVVGNAKTESLLDIWHGDKLASIHRDHLMGNRSKYTACKSCDTIYNSPDSVDSLTVDEYDRRINQ
jgi:radical SAM protein with 4Fe4S-binding SPASM domain